MDEMSAIDWSTVLVRDGPNSKVEALHAIFEDMVDRHFTVQICQRRETDLP